jgi:hydrogenase maturation protein HypF
MQEARELLRQGRIVAIKGLGGFQLACDATNDDAVRALRSRKKRSDKPFALMARDLAAIERFCLVSAADRAALLSPARPIVILPRRPDAPISLEVAPGNRTLGVMLPYTPLHHLLFGDSQQPGPYFLALVMTSGNLSEEPIVTANGEAWERLACVADWFLFHNRDIYMRVDDSVVRTFEDKEFTLRRARGYVPRPIDLGIPLQQVLACGAELKNTFCLTKEHYAIVSQHIGDLENYETLVFFRETLENMKKLFRVEPRIAAYDLHPLYLSTRLALEMEGIEKVGVQHHHAHIASCMAENHVSGRVIGVAFDGTGYGTDGKIWGGEFLLADFAGFERAAHLTYVPLTGGDTAIRQPWRSALSHLLAAYPDGRSWSHLWPEVPAKAVALVEAMIRRGVNAVDTSSCGRLFDAVAAIVGLRHEVNFEAQAAMELEAIAEEGVEEAYPFEVTLANGKRPAGMPAGAAGRQECLPYEIDVRPMIRAVVEDVQHGAAAGRISARFHNTVAGIIVETCRAIREANGLERVCLSGGTFQNMYLLTRAVAGLRRAGFEMFLHSAVPPNDGGISLGQAVIANTKKS